MQEKEKNFKCVHCQKETYSDYQVCEGCSMNGSIKPIPKTQYKCYLNDSLYGSGDLEYINQLFCDYVVNCGMYGKEQAEFKIVRM